MKLSDAYEQGKQAGLESQPIWMNPYSEPSSPVHMFHAWFAGWCNGRKEYEDDLDHIIMETESNANHH